MDRTELTQGGEGFGMVVEEPVPQGFAAAEEVPVLPARDVRAVEVNIAQPMREEEHPMSLFKFVGRALSLRPPAAPDYLSEHGKRAEKRNDPRPELVDPRV